MLGAPFCELEAVDPLGGGRNEAAVEGTKVGAFIEEGGNLELACNSFTVLDSSSLF